MEDKNTAIRLLFPNAFMATIDLQDAYFSVKIWRPHRKYLRFRFNGILYEYTCMPFGLCSAPLIFIKLLKPVLFCSLFSWISY